MQIGDKVTIHSRVYGNLGHAEVVRVRGGGLVQVKDTKGKYHYFWAEDLKIEREEGQ